MSSNFFGLNKKTVIGMVHCLALPGTPKYGGDMDKIIAQAVQDAQTLEKAGCDAVIIENMGDDPFGIFLDVAQSTALAAVSAIVSQSIKLPIGIDAAMNDYKSAISIAQAIGASFVRLPVFVDTVEYSGCGIINPCSRAALYYRKQIGAENIKIFADIHVKHTHMLLPHVTIEDSARAAEASQADAIIVTGTHIGLETPIDLIKNVKNVVSIPVFAGSGVNANNVKEQLDIADGAIIGSGLKENGNITNPVSYNLTDKIIKALQ